MLIMILPFSAPSPSFLNDDDEFFLKKSNSKHFLSRDHIRFPAGKGWLKKRASLPSFLLT